MDGLYYLNQYLEGDAKKLVAGCLYMDGDEGYHEARRLLEDEYGDSYKIASTFLNRILAWPSIKPDDPTGLKRLSMFLIECEHAMRKIEGLSALNHVPNLQEVVQKLPIFLQHRWRENVSKVRKRKNLVEFSDLRQFIADAAKTANDPCFSKEAMTSKSQKTLPMTSKTKSFATNVTSANRNAGFSEKPVSTACLYCSFHHDNNDCYTSEKLTLDAKRKYVQEQRLCFACLRTGHISKNNCLHRQTCKTCSRRHPTSLHSDNGPPASTNSHETVPTPMTATSTANNEPHSVGHRMPAQSSTSTTTPPMKVQCGTCQSKQSHSVVTPHSILLVRVKQQGSDRSIVTYAFYDNGSSGCFITNQLRDDLQASGTDVTLELRTMHGRSYVKSSSVCDLEVTDLDYQNTVVIPKVYTREEIPVERSQIPRPEILAAQFPDVIDKLPEYLAGVDIGLLIGSSCPEALQPLQVLPAQGKGPFAMLLRHGWTVNGPVQVTEDWSFSCATFCNIIQLNIVKEVLLPSPTDFLHAMEADFNGCCVGKTPNDRGPSCEDLVFLKRANESMRRVDGHFELSLPFRNESLKMPNNRNQAVRRAMLQGKKMISDQSYYDDYRNFIDTLISKGYAEKVSDDDSHNTGSIWYLPHHGVYHPRKKKLRVVFDCAAKYQGTSLYDQLMQGPDLTNSVVGVLTRFRNGPVAFIADIETMFYQVRVPEHQRDYLRFVWWPHGDLTAQLEDYRMTVHLFGASSSPSISNFALRQTAEKCNPMVGSTIQRNFYVDDCLKAVDSDVQGIDLAEKVRAACATGGFRLTKFTSNSRSVLESIPLEDRNKDVQTLNLNYDSLPNECALGVQWKLSTDQLGFSISTAKPGATTRRGILSKIASVYDPLGLLAPFILPAKKILQDICKEEGLRWDDKVPECYQSRWQRWVNELPKMEQFAVSRCYILDSFGPVISRQLHVFSDACKDGYGACAYLRVSNEMGEVHCALLMGKSRVVLLRMVTIPKLELTAAAIAVQIDSMLSNELEPKPDSIVYHTDSTTVLHYIHNRTKRFPVFVANRVQQIHDFSSPSQWKYVRTDCNPADCASRGLYADCLLRDEMWVSGPKFLRISEAFEPQPCVFPSPDDDAEPVTTHSTAANEVPTEETQPVGFHKLVAYYSSLSALKKAVAVYRRVFQVLKQKTLHQDPPASQDWLSSPFSVLEMIESETSIFKFIQQQHFRTDLDRLRNEHKDRKFTPLIRLDPILINGLIRVGGRLNKAALEEDEKHPVVLPRKSHVTTLVIRHIHERLGHAGRNHVLAKLRENTWVVSANSAVRHVLTKCVQCRRQRGQTCEQKMADLPASRTSTEPPFTYTGTDLFGPFHVTENRKVFKRYGVIFTCFSSRAIHLEMVNSLETDSFINALRRFLARRGPVRTIFCDNGTNFVGAERELRASIKEMDNQRIQKYLLEEKIDWSFNPPAASHFGGVWESDKDSTQGSLGNTPGK